MNKRLLLFCAFFFSFGAMAQENSQETHVLHAPITQQQAIDIAKTYAIIRGYVEAEWFGGDVISSFDKNEWKISFRGKPVDGNNLYLTGDHFYANVSADGEVK